MPLLVFIVLVTRILKGREFLELREARRLHDVERFRSIMFNIWKFYSFLIFTLSEPYVYIVDTYVLGIKYPTIFLCARMGIYYTTLLYLIALKTGKMRLLWWGRKT